MAAPSISRFAAQSGILLPQVTSYKDKPIDYIDPAPKPLVIVIPFIEYVERVKRIKLDAWQRNFCQRLEDAAVGRTTERVWAVIHAEGQLGKSIILVQAFSAWLLGHDPLHRIALATYNVTRSQRHSKVVIGIMNLPVHKAIFDDPDGWVDEKTSKEKWSTAARIRLNDGQDSFNPVGLQSGLTGSGFDTLLIDDPYSDQKEAFSETTRANLQEFWDFTVMSRMGTHTNVFGMFHRYHVEDLAGYLLDKGSFDYWRYATICDGPFLNDETGQQFEDPLGREIGEYISPERRPPSYYTDARKNSRVWNSMFQGRPSSEEGEFFQINKIKMLSAAETEQRRRECTVFVRAWDLAATEEGGDYSVGELWGISPDKHATLFDVKREQVGSGGRDALQLRTAQEDGAAVIVSIPNDPGAAGNTAVFHIQQLLKDFTVVAQSTSGSKENRARPLASAVEEGRISFASDEHLPTEKQWLKEVKKEWRNFPLSDHDDTVDAGADGYNECSIRVVKGRVVQGLSSLQTWAEFIATYGSDAGLIPQHWTVYAALKISAEANAPNSGVIVARAPQNTGLKDHLFVLAEYKAYDSDYPALFTWLDTTLKAKCERPQTSIIHLHKDSEAFLPTIRMKLDYPVRLFNEAPTAGITEINWYGQNGALVGIVDDVDQLDVAKDAKGLVSVRQEALTWGFNDKGLPNGVGQVWDDIRMIAYAFRTVATDYSFEEKLEQRMPEALRIETIAAMPQGVERDGTLLRRGIEEKRVRQEMQAPVRRTGLLSRR